MNTQVFFARITYSLPAIAMFLIVSSGLDNLLGEFIYNMLFWSSLGISTVIFIYALFGLAEKEDQTSVPIPDNVTNLNNHEES
ncbi:MAG: hypothetical protein V7749_00575 [Cocleimonas sp.]